ncbi:DUF4367 domain-containing protein [Brevibacillus reuszeri]|uniref:DUF4367 domain-containing protein n=1 Tax=Brevibacillus reuszeri TaxID=54915 RepID=UPI000CCBF30D|nr:DUF4367 domain-containing protein [Brevibacillus reuszeri]
MKTDKVAKHFNEDLDLIMNGKQPPKRPEASDEYAEMIEISSALKKVDFSSEYGLPEKSKLREKVIAIWIKEEKRMEKQMGLRSRFFTRKIAAAVAVITLVGAIAFSEPLLAFANHATESISKIVQLGYTSVMQMEDQAPPVDKQNASLVQDSEKTLVIANDQPLEIDRAIYATLAEAQKTVSYKLLSPTYLPAGYSFKEASGFKGEGADQYMDLYFSGPDKEIVLMTRVLKQETAFGVATSSNVHSLSVNGNNAAWIEPHTLMWEQEGVSYSLFCKGFGKDEALKIANSFK